MAGLAFHVRDQSEAAVIAELTGCVQSFCQRRFLHRPQFQQRVPRPAERAALA